MSEPIRIRNLDALEGANIPLDASLPVDMSSAEAFSRVRLYDAMRIPSASCNTAAATAEKVCLVGNFTNLSLIDGMQIMVFFTYANTADNVSIQLQYTDSAGSVVSLDAKNAYYMGSTVQLGSGSIKAGTVIKFIYNSSLDALIADLPYAVVPEIIDDLTSTSIKDGLSANQGKYLNSAMGNRVFKYSTGGISANGSYTISLPKENQSIFRLNIISGASGDSDFSDYEFLIFYNTASETFSNIYYKSIATSSTFTITTDKSAGTVTIATTKFCVYSFMQIK